MIVIHVHAIDQKGGEEHQKTNGDEEGGNGHRSCLKIEWADLRRVFGLIEVRTKNELADTSNTVIEIQNLRQLNGVNDVSVLVHFASWVIIE